MSESISTPVALPDLLQQTPLLAHLAGSEPGLALTSFRGAQTIQVFAGVRPELAALTSSAGVFDLGYRSFVKITGSDQIRWLNGMVTNTIVGLDDGQGNYSFLLNAQGRVLGDATVYRFGDHLLLETDRSQATPLIAHLDHFIIMDDVELQILDGAVTAIGIAGPDAAEILAKLGLAIPSENGIVRLGWRGNETHVSRQRSPLVPRFEVILPVTAAVEFWEALTTAGGTPCGAEAIEALRILEGTPLYGVDITDRHLPQETAQTHALNFSKGCYLGQEIVERIRSRATVHRTFKQFSVAGPIAAVQVGQTLPLEAEGAQQNPAGQLSSVAEYDLPGVSGTLALGFVRVEALERKLPLSCTGIGVTALDAPLKIERKQTSSL
jgi:folate-binding protein YgfZ